MKKILFLLIGLCMFSCSSRREAYQECQDAMVMMQTNRPQEAIQKVDKVINSYDDYVSAYLIRAQCYAILKNYQQMKMDCNKVLELKDDEGLAYYLRGEASQVTGDLQNALNDYNQAIKLCHTGWQSELHLRRGIVRYHLGDKQGACTDWDVVRKYHNAHLIPKEANTICN